MISLKTLTFAACTAALLTLSPVGAKPAAAAEPFTAEQKAALEDYVRDFILNNPEVLIEAVNRFKAKEEQKQEADAVAALDKHKDYLYKNKELPQAGNPKGDITVIEFFDYNCGYCKRAFETVTEAIKDDKKLRIVFIELPILSPQSKTAAQWGLAANMQGKYFEYHTALMTTTEPKTDEMLERTAKELGLDIEKMKKDAASEEVAKMLEKKVEIARDLRISGTPGFIVGDQIIRGYIPYDAMKGMIAEARKKGTKD